MSTFFDCWHF